MHPTSPSLSEPVVCGSDSGGYFCYYFEERDAESGCREVIALNLVALASGIHISSQLFQVIKLEILLDFLDVDYKVLKLTCVILKLYRIPKEFFS